MNVIEKFELIEGDTFVSNYGRVVNADGPHNGKKVFKVRYELKTSIIDPYVYVWVKKNRYQLHKLVAQYFMGWNGEGYVNHLDCESRNNFVGNLVISTKKHKPTVWDIPEYHNGRVYKVENNRIFKSKVYVKKGDRYNGEFILVK